MARGPAHPGPRDGSKPLVWVLAGVCVALIVLVLKLSIAPGEHDLAFVYVVVGAAAGLLLYRLRRRRTMRH